MRKKAVAAKGNRKMEKKWFLLAKKPVLTSQNEGLFLKIHFQCLRNR